MTIRHGLLLLLLLFGIPAVASHIVGGEFELLYISPNTYRLNMILYFDLKNGASDAEDKIVRVYVYRKSDNAPVESFDLRLTNRQSVSYTQPICSKGEVQTNKLTYTNLIILRSALYSDAGGYYIAWQRCCRNYNIRNIYSEPTNNPDNTPNPNAKYAGQTFYLEFPPIIKNGQPFKNSSPRLFPPLNDYACPGQPYYATFTGSDDDGDSLAYSLTTPLNTTTGEALPKPAPAPYPLVQWQTGYSLDKITRGNPDLRISPDGFLRVTPPRVQGLFAFAVKVEEFRNKVKIGETRRDFQLYVTDRCSDAVPPIIKGKELTDADYSDAKVLNVTFDADTPDDERCINIQVTDADSSLPPTFTENIKVSVKALNFSSSNLNSILPTATSYELHYGRPDNLTICFPKCPFITNGPARIAIIVHDNACAVPLTDTLKVNVTVIPPSNTSARFTQPTVNPFIQNTDEGSTALTFIEAVDSDNDNITLTALPVGYSFSDYGMSFRVTETRPGLARGTFTFAVDCNNYNFADKNSFRVLLSADDADLCKINPAAKVEMNLTAVLTQRSLPIIDSDLTPDAQETSVDVNQKIGEPLSFTVTGRTDNLGVLELVGQGVGFDWTTYRMTFPPTRSPSPVSAVFNWTPQCADLKNKSDYRLRFVASDKTNLCTAKNGDTLLVNVKLSSFDNTTPKLHFDNTQLLPLTDNAYELNYGTKVNFNIRGVDEDADQKDTLTLDLTHVNGEPTPKGYEFKQATRQGLVTSPFIWPTDCSVFKNKESRNSFGFVFKVSDNHCTNPLQVTDTLRLRVITPSDEGDFTPPNVITPNGDGCNDYFAVEDISDATCGLRALKINFPKDNCLHTFEYIKILSRYGKEIFHSQARNFRWYAAEVPTGVYYYFIKFSDGIFKGAVQVIR